LRRESLPFTQPVRLPLAKLSSVSEMRIALVFSIGNFFCFPSSKRKTTTSHQLAGKILPFRQSLDSYSVAAIRSLSFDSLCAETAQIIVTSQEPSSS
jgi:hypothetical protein